MGKYDGGDFNDPIVRCTECQKILFRAELEKSGRCICGCRKVRNVFSLSGSEVKLLQNKRVDPEFIEQFQASAELIDETKDLPRNPLF